LTLARGTSATDPSGPIMSAKVTTWVRDRNSWIIRSVRIETLPGRCPHTRVVVGTTGVGITQKGGDPGVGDAIDVRIEVGASATTGVITVEEKVGAVFVVVQWC